MFNGALKPLYETSLLKIPIIDNKITNNNICVHCDKLSESQSEKIKAILDANIIMKLRGNNTSEPSQDPQALLADCLVSEVDYYYAPEILSEIARDKDTERVENTKKFLGNFYEAIFDIEEC